MHQTRAFALFTLTIFVCLGTTIASATQFLPLSIEQLTKKSALVLQGTVVSKTTQRDPTGRIYTRIELQVTEAWKGSPKSDRFVLVSGGGVLGDQSSHAIGQESYDIGEEVVAFVVLNDRGEGVTLGMAQGKFHISADPDTGEQEVHNLFHGRHADLEKRSEQQKLSLIELKQRVKAANP